MLCIFFRELVVMGDVLSVVVHPEPDWHFTAPVVMEIESIPVSGQTVH